MERFILERATDRVLLSLEFPLAPSGAGVAVSSSGKLSGVVPPVADLPEIVPHQSLIHREVDKVIKGTFIVTRWSEGQSGFQLEGAGFSSHLGGLRYDGVREWVDADPIAIARHCWEHAQSKTGANLGVATSGASPERIGSPARDVSFTTGAGGSVDFEAGPYKLAWWDTPDLGAKVRELTEAAGYEFYEWSGWNETRTAIDREVRFVPVVGSPKSILFSTGSNIVDVVDVVADGSEYANVVIALGAGEGAKSLRVTLAVPDGRLRRERVIERKNITSKKALEAEARAELRLAQRNVEIAAIEVMNHESALFGTFGVGDVVDVHVDTDRHGAVDQRSRIIEIEEAGETAKLALEAV